MSTRQKGQAKVSQDYTRNLTEWRHQRYNNKKSKCIETQSKTNEQLLVTTYLKTFGVQKIQHENKLKTSSPKGRHI